LLCVPCIHGLLRIARELRDFAGLRPSNWSKGDGKDESNKQAAELIHGFGSCLVYTTIALFSDHFADGNGRSCRWRWGVTDMEHPAGLEEEKIMHERAVPQDCLGADSGLFREQIAKREARTIFPAFFQVATLPKRITHLNHSGLQMRSDCLPESGEGAISGDVAAGE